MDLRDLERLYFQGDAVVTETLTNLIQSAVDNRTARHGLSQIADFMSSVDGEFVERCLDPLSTLSYLVRSTSPGSSVILELMMDKCSPKEVIVAAEECLEWIHRAVIQDSAHDDDDEEEEEEEEKGEMDDARLLISDQIPRLVHIFSVIYKMSFRRKSPLETIKSFIPELQSTIEITREMFSRNSGRQTIFYCAVLAERILHSFEAWEAQDEEPKVKRLRAEDSNACKAILLPFLTSIIDTLGHNIQSELAKRAFKVCYPRLATRNELDPGWMKGAEVAAAVTSAYTRVEDAYPVASTRTSLLLLSHSLLPSLSDVPNPPITLNRKVEISTCLPVILASLQANTLLDESLALLLLQFDPSVSQPPSSPEILSPLLALIPSLASFHPDPFIRLCTFKLLGLVLDAAPDVLRIRALKDLVGNDANGSGKMRVAAVGLVKYAVIKALAHSPSVLGSPNFLQSFAPILFVPDPPDLFDALDIGIDDETREKNIAKVLMKLEQESVQLELSRLAECLGLYYVLQRRDAENRTGIRDRDNRANIERTLLAPIRKVLPNLIAIFKEGGEGEAAMHDEASASTASRIQSHRHHHDKQHALLVPIISLQVALERIDEG
ncbi:hypothetical protein D9757_008518 [Collybiopsis confluens]|uniref:ARM repeat superfamily protein n=1 Tax=Collybiopsis confluens TaxID=2823264 RepID=A0A8H5H2Q2_9AGAR|nr:hypothetical protein D9757_008518 [Collybiopsis confluens]